MTTSVGVTKLRILNDYIVFKIYQVTSLYLIKIYKKIIIVEYFVTIRYITGFKRVMLLMRYLFNPNTILKIRLRTAAAEQMM